MNMLSGIMGGFSPLTNVGQFAGGVAGMGLNINIGLNLAGQAAQIRQPLEVFTPSSELGSIGYNQNLLSSMASGMGASLNGLSGFPGLGQGMGMVPGFGGTVDPAGSLFGGLMQQMQSQQQMLQMMMMMLMMMMQQQQNGFGAQQGVFPGMGGMPGMGGGAPGFGGGIPGFAGGAPGIGGAAPAGASSVATPANASQAPQSTAEIQQRLAAAGVSAADKAKIAQLSPEMQAKTTQLYEYAKQNGMSFTITSGKRDMAQQQALYAKYGPRRAAKPGSSPHETGLAIDINADATTQRRLGAYWKSIGGRWGGDWGGPGSTTQQELWHFDIKK